MILVSGAQASIGRAHPTMYDAVFDKPNSQKLSKTSITTPVSLVMLPHIVFMHSKNILTKTPTGHATKTPLQYSIGTVCGRAALADHIGLPVDCGLLASQEQSGQAGAWPLYNHLPAAWAE
jgi:hypothetical protein